MSYGSNTALLIDVGDLRAELKKNDIPYEYNSVKKMVEDIQDVLSTDVWGKGFSLTSHRITLYDAPPYRGTITSPTGASVTFNKKDYILDRLKKNGVVADIRWGNTIFSHWELNSDVFKAPVSTFCDMIKQGLAPSNWKQSLLSSVSVNLCMALKNIKSPDNLYKAVFSQKQVDTLITMDLQKLENDESIHRIALVTNDTDFCPAIQKVQNEGKMVNVITLGSQEVAGGLKRVVGPQGVLNIPLNRFGRQRD